VACRTAPIPEPLSNAAPPPPREPTIAFDADTESRIALGLPVHIELRATSPSTVVLGTCVASYDLWDENYRVTIDRVETRVLDPRGVIDACLDRGKLAEVRGTRGFSNSIVAREITPPDPLYRAPRVAPIF
jgi:hypothetical protein